MYLERYRIRNFRRLENVEISLQQNETIFVGPNNSGKTSAVAVFKRFLGRSCEFSLYDFYSPLIVELDNAAVDGAEGGFTFPLIELDLWFAVAPDTEWGRVAWFLPSLSAQCSEIGVRIAFSADDPNDLLAKYKEAYPKQEKPISHYLSKELTRHYSRKYFILEMTGDGEAESHPCKREEGQKGLDGLLRVDYIDAQRKIDDLGSKQSNRLSDVFASFYRHNLEQRGPAVEGIELLEKINDDLSLHYEQVFGGIVSVISALGYPGLNDRGLTVLSSLSPDKALAGNTELVYTEADSGHRLPEAYNGLGFKNLIYIALQISHFQKQWHNTQENRPACQLILMEEPEVHLHAQVQQTFVRKIHDVLEYERANAEKDTPDLPPGHSQLVITTHSSHIAAETEFGAIRYFRRARGRVPGRGPEAATSASEVRNLAKFDDLHSDSDCIRFLKQYMKLTHCDLFFADAAILVEGAVEKLLMPLMIEKTAGELKSAYLTTLELGGAYAHKFRGLLEFIALPSLVITDLDSVIKKNGAKRACACRADTVGATTSNASLKELLGTDQIGELLSLLPERRTIRFRESCCRVAHQKPVAVEEYGSGRQMIPRTFEESFIYENLERVRNGDFGDLVRFEGVRSFCSDYDAVYETVKRSGFKKVEFALTLLERSDEWDTPEYVQEGLGWLKGVFRPNTECAGLAEGVTERPDEKPA